jgi:hypothetical protein
MKIKDYTTDEERAHLQTRIHQAIELLQGLDEQSQKAVYKAVFLLSVSFDSLSIHEFRACGLDKWLTKIQDTDGLIPIEVFL